eukprot:m.510898 g.510898  ORF g.510898 m.510898 type:complete len:311 (+) comp57422_c0_seq8:504-1436(+)
MYYWFRCAFCPKRFACSRWVMVRAGRGLTGTSYRISVTYSASSDSGKRPPTTFVAKLSHASPDGRRNTIVSGQYREAHFYNSRFATEMPSSLLPKAIYAYGSGFLGEFVVILEDVTLQPVAPVNFVFGNQIWGIPKALDPPQDPIVVLEAMFLAAADQHARTWRSPVLLEQSWLKGASWYRGQGREAWERAIARSRNSWEAAKLTPIAVKFSEKLVAVMDKSFQNASWEWVQRRLHDPAIPFALCHGDFHAANMFLRTGADPIQTAADASLVMFDWSEVLFSRFLSLNGLSLWLWRSKWSRSSLTHRWSV